MKTLTAFCCIALAGCAAGWSKPGATEQEFYRDRSECQAEAFQRYPVQQVTQGGYTPPAQTKCVAGPYGQVNCTTTQQPTMYQTTSDVNQSGRNMYVDGCLRGRGYTFSIR